MPSPQSAFASTETQRHVKPLRMIDGVRFEVVKATSLVLMLALSLTRIKKGVALDLSSQYVLQEFPVPVFFLARGFFIG